jgi:hypothetical protein
MLNRPGNGQDRQRMFDRAGLAPSATFKRRRQMLRLHGDAGVSQTEQQG